MRKCIYFLPAIVWTFLIFYLCTLPGNEIPHFPFLDKIYFDKWVHAALFAGFVFLWSWGVLKARVDRTTLALWIFFSMAVLCGIAIEYIQYYFVPSRSYDVGDMIADAAGAFMGVYVFKWLQRKGSLLKSSIKKSLP